MRTTHICPPIPLYDFDWQAVEDDYEPGRPIGYGRTEQAAIDDLNAQLRELADADE
jgi:hypothetical protein